MVSESMTSMEGIVVMLAGYVVEQRINDITDTGKGGCTSPNVWYKSPACDETNGPNTMQ